jgi:hypothetical protein
MRVSVGLGIVALAIALPASAAAQGRVQYAPTPYATSQNGNAQYGQTQVGNPQYRATPYAQNQAAPPPQYVTPQYSSGGYTNPSYTNAQYTQSASAQASGTADASAQVATPTPPPPDAVCNGSSCQLRRSSSSCSSSSCSSCSSSSCGSSNCGCDSHPSVRLSLTGLRFSATRVSTSAGQSTNNYGLGFAGGVDTYALDGGARGSLNWVLGGGDAGFEGMLAGTVDVGYRLDVTERTGPFGRAGFDGRMQGNDRLYFSTLELPRLTLGWQYLDGKTAIEGGIRAGPILSGRYNPGDAGDRRLSGSFEYGAFASATVSILKMEATVMRIDAKDTLTGRPVDVARGSFCAIAGKVGICGDLMGIRGDANMGPNGGGVQVAHAGYAGVSIGVASW